MASSSCPSCGKPIQQLEIKANGSVFYCEVCGWNVAGAQFFLQNFRRQLRLAILFFVVTLSAGMVISPNRNSLEDGLLIILLLAISFAVVWRRLSRDTHRLEEIRSNLGGAISREATITKPDPSTLAHFNRLRSLPCPRPVKLTQTARVALNLTKIIPIGMALWGIHDLILPSRPIALAARTVIQAQAFGLGILGLGVLLWFLLSRTFVRKTELYLLENGEITLARVIGPSVRSRFIPSLGYEFTDPKGAVTRGEMLVLAGTIVEGDYIVVFYDPRKPVKCVALCATSYEFALL